MGIRETDVYESILEAIDVDMARLSPIEGKPDAIGYLSKCYSDLIGDCDKMFEYLENGSIML